MAFEKGKSGNPTGRPKAETSAQKLRALISTKDVKDILSALVEQAKQGDIQAAKLILDRVLPPLKAIEPDNVTNEPPTIKVEFVPSRMSDQELERIARGE